MTTYIVKFYDSQENFDSKNPFKIEEMVGSLEEVTAKAEAIKNDIKAYSFKIKENI